MALRLGTGGLKYPIPVAPDAQQSIAAASAGGSAAASAYGANRSFAANKMRVQADLANSAAERDFRARSQMEEQGFRARENFYDREHQAGAQLQGQEFRANQEELDRNFRAFQQQSGQNFQLNRDKTEMDFTRERDQTQFDRSQTDERVQDESIRTGISSGDLVLSKGGQAAWDKLQSDRAAAALQKDLSPEGRAEAERKFDERERGILRTARPPLQSPDQGWNQNVVHVDAEGNAHPKAIPGVTRAYDPKTRQPIVEQPDTSKQDAKRLAEEEKRARDIMNQVKEKGEKITPEQAMSQARMQMVEEQAGFDRARNPLPHPPMLPPGQQPNAPAPGQPAPGQPQRGLSKGAWNLGGGNEPNDLGGWSVGRGAAPAPGQQAPPVPLPGKPVGPTPTPQTLPLNPATASSAGPVPLGGPRFLQQPGVAVTPGARQRHEGSIYSPPGKPQGFIHDPAVAQAKPDVLPTVANPRERDALPSGAYYLDENGKLRRRK